MGIQEQVVIVVGAGPSGLATAACLSQLSIPYIIIEREDCFGSLWKKKSYDRLHLHLAKQFCELPHMSFPTTCPTYVPREQFIQYLDDYVSHFKISPLYQRSVDSAIYDEVNQKWIVKVKNNIMESSGEEYSGRFLVVATGETSDVFIPKVDGLSSFKGEVIHSTQYKCGKKYIDSNVLVVGAGNSGMEIAFDLSNYGAKTSIVVRSPVRTSHVHLYSSNFIYLNLISGSTNLFDQILYISILLCTTSLSHIQQVK